MPAYKDKNRNTWYVKFSRNNKQILKRGFPTKRDALKYEANYIDETSDDITFQELADSYYQYRDVAESTRKRQLPLFRKYVSFKDKKYSKLSKKVLMEWYLDVQKNHLSVSTKNLLLRVVKQISKYGTEFYDLPNYASALKAYKTTKKEMQTWTVDEFDKFISCVELEYYRVYFITLYWSGMRKSECLRLKKSDIEGCRVHIRGTKTSHSDRYITIPDALRAILEPILARCESEQDYIFPLNENTMYLVWRRSVEESGVKQIRLHDLRHSFATNAINNGCDIVAVSKYLGHADISTTLRVYTHLLEKTELDMVNKLSEQISVSKLYQTYK